MSWPVGPRPAGFPNSAGYQHPARPEPAARPSRARFLCEAGQPERIQMNWTVALSPGGYLNLVL